MKRKIIKKVFVGLTLLCTSIGYGQSCNTSVLEDGLYSPSLIITCDFNGDDLEDIVYLDSLSNNVFWKKNNGNSQFSNPISLVGGAEMKFLKSADLNNDGYYEILIATNSTVYYVGYTGINSIDFQSLMSVPVLYVIQDIEVGDFNNDGDEGFVLGYYRASTLNLIVDVINNVNGTLSSENILSGTYGSLSDIAVGKINADNRLDIATAGYSNFWFRNINGTGQFSSSNTISSASSDFGKIAIMDYDNDNNVELVNLNSDGILQSYGIDITNGGWIYSPVTLLTGLPTSTDVWESVTYNGEDLILIKSVNELIGLKNVGNSFTENSICTSINGLKNATLLTNTDGTSDFIYSNVSEKTIVKINSALSSLDEPLSKRNLLCYPNPTSGVVNINLEGAAIKSVKLINALGQIMEPIRVYSNQFDISTFSNGLYQLIIMDEYGVESSQTILKK